MSFFTEVEDSGGSVEKYKTRFCQLHFSIQCFPLFFSGPDPHQQQSRSSSVVSNLINNNSNAAVIGGTAAATTAAGQLQQQQQQQNSSSQLPPLSDVTNLNFIHHHNNLNNQVNNYTLGFFATPRHLYGCLKAQHNCPIYNKCLI